MNTWVGIQFTIIIVFCRHNIRSICDDITKKSVSNFTWLNSINFSIATIITKLNDFTLACNTFFIETGTCSVPTSIFCTWFSFFLSHFIIQLCNGSRFRSIITKNIHILCLLFTTNKKVNNISNSLNVKKKNTKKRQNFSVRLYGCGIGYVVPVEPHKHGWLMHTTDRIGFSGYNQKNQNTLLCIWSGEKNK